MSGNIPDMEILLAGGVTKAAKDLKVGDKVETLHQDTLKKGEHEVTYVRIIESPLLSLNLSGKTFTCAEEDRFYSTNRKGWLHATDLVKGDKISKLDGEVEFEGSTKIGKGQSVELTIDEAHTYICHDNRILLHNKGGGGGPPPPPPPPPKIYTQKAYDEKLAEAKKGWHEERQKVYDQRLAGQKELWGAQEEARRQTLLNEQRTLYDTRLGDARTQWHTDAESRYDRRLGEARTGWHTQAEKAYDARIKKAKSKQEALQGKYGDLEGRFGDLQSRYDTRVKDYDTLQGRYDERGRKYSDLQGKYDERGREYGDLEGRFSTSQRDYETLKGRYGEEKRKRQRADTGRRRGGGLGGRAELDQRGSAPSSSGGLSSDAQRHALLTGDYSFLQTDKGRARGGSGRDENWRQYL